MWISIKTEQQIEDLLKESFDQPVVLFKHSNRCGTSMMAYDHLTENWEKELLQSVPVYLNNVVEERELARYIAGKLGVIHQSPQVFVIRDGKAVYHTSHYRINYKALKKELIGKAGILE